MTTALRLSFPQGKLWQKITADPLTLALGGVLENLRTAARQIIAESNPGTAVDTLPEWHAALGQKYDATRPIAEQRTRLESIRLSIGGMTLYQLQEQMSKEFPTVTISEVSANSESGVEECGVAYTAGVEGDYSPLYFDVSGVLADDIEAARVGSIIDHFSPFHLVACMSLTIEGLSSTSESGVALCGVEETGSSGI